jgi:predicted DNA-binding transcriptional regulator AlpA
MTMFPIDPPPRPPYTLKQIAELLGHGLPWLYHHRRELEAAGFPKPISPIGRPRFHRASIDAWLERHHPHASPLRHQAPATAGEDSAEAQDWDRRFFERYGRPPV